MKRKYEVEVFNSQIGDTDYGKSKSFGTYQKTVDYAKGINPGKHEYVFVYVPKNDGCTDYYLREEWTGGYHEKLLDAEIY